MHRMELPINDDETRVERVDFHVNFCGKRLPNNSLAIIYTIKIPLFDERSTTIAYLLM